MIQQCIIGIWKYVYIYIYIYIITVSTQLYSNDKFLVSQLLFTTTNPNEKFLVNFTTTNPYLSDSDVHAIIQMGFLDMILTT